MKMKPLKKVALTVVVIWTIIVTTLTANLIISSKKSAVKNAKDDAFSAIDHIDATIKLLINDYQINNMSLSRQLDLKGLESNSGVVSIELGIEKPKVSLVFVQENSNPWTVSPIKKVSNIIKFNGVYIHSTPPSGL